MDLTKLTEKELLIELMYASQVYAERIEKELKRRL